MSDGTDNTNCGHPCEKHQVAVRDQHGREHPVMADVGCRNTVFGAEAQTDPAAMRTWQTAGLRHFRIEFVHESETEVADVIKCFDGYLNGTSTTDQLQTSLEEIM